MDRRPSRRAAELEAVRRLVRMRPQIELAFYAKSGYNAIRSPKCLAEPSQ